VIGLVQLLDRRRGGRIDRGNALLQKAVKVADILGEDAVERIGECEGYRAVDVLLCAGAIPDVIIGDRTGEPQVDLGDQGAVNDRL
jgi:hypothetical protein